MHVAKIKDSQKLAYQSREIHLLYNEDSQSSEYTFDRICYEILKIYISIDEKTRIECYSTLATPFAKPTASKLPSGLNRQHITSELVSLC